VPNIDIEKDLQRLYACLIWLRPCTLDFSLYGINGRESHVNNGGDEMRISSNKWKRIVTASVAILVLTAILQLPGVYVQGYPAHGKLVSWIGQVSEIPVKVPESWKKAAEESKAVPFAVEADNGKIPDLDMAKVRELEEKNALATVEKKYMYFEVSRSADSYGIAAYMTAVPVPVNDKKTLLEKNGPVCQADVLGYISGERITDRVSTADTYFTKPEDRYEFEITPGIKAFGADMGCTVWWDQGNWSFEYSGTNSGSFSRLGSLAQAWSDIPPAVAKLKGRIRIVEGNKFHASITWEQNGVRYTYDVPYGDWIEVIQMLDSFAEEDKVSRSGL